MLLAGKGLLSKTKGRGDLFLTTFFISKKRYDFLVTPRGVEPPSPE